MKELLKNQNKRNFWTGNAKTNKKKVGSYWKQSKQSYITNLTTFKCGPPTVY